MTAHGIDARVEYLSAGANRFPASADWGDNGILAFGAGTNIALWCPSTSPPRGISALLKGHESPVRAVSFIPGADADITLPNQLRVDLITGCESGTLKRWSGSAAASDVESIRVVDDLVKVHASPVNCITTCRTVKSKIAPCIAVSGSADYTLKVFQLDKSLREIQTIQTEPAYIPLALALTRLQIDPVTLMLAVAGTWDRIQVFVASSSTGREGVDQFSLCATLSGHEGWIRSLDIAPEHDDLDSDLLLASTSQDKYVRLWRIRQSRDADTEPAPQAHAELSIGPASRRPAITTLSNKSYRVSCGGRTFSIAFEALMLGHEDWVYSAKWHCRPGLKPLLLSASADNSLNVWEEDQKSGLWLSVARLGEINRELGSTTATGSAGGFWTGLWASDGRSIISIGKTGSWRRWEVEQDSNSTIGPSLWRQSFGVSGHTRAITGITWSAIGDYLLSTSLDQTTRLHAEWRQPAGLTWHEMARPQIHGYDLNCIDTLSPSLFVSGADEKLLRVFREPRPVAELLYRLSEIKAPAVEFLTGPADIPMLGLSNKAVDTSLGSLAISDAADTAPDSTHSMMLATDQPPTEDTLARYTLWPEIEKLYGHGYEMSCAAASHDGALIASACRASSATHAVIRLVETTGWHELRPPLTSHSLTVHRLRFSPPDDCFLLSVGRDRAWTVFERSPGEGATPIYAVRQTQARAHQRMLLDAAWAPGGRAFVTTGRDGKVCLWALPTVAAGAPGGTAKFVKVSTFEVGQDVTAADFLPWAMDGRVYLAVGDQKGRLSVLEYREDSFEMVLTGRVDERLCPNAITQLAWRPSPQGEHSLRPPSLAVAGEDGSLRVMELKLGAATSPAA